MGCSNSQNKSYKNNTVISESQPSNPILPQQTILKVPEPVQYPKGKIFNLQPVGTFINNEEVHILVSLILTISNDEILVTFTNYSIAYFSIDFQTKKIIKKCLEQKLFNSEILYLHLLENKEILSCSGTFIKKLKVSNDQITVIKSWIAHLFDVLQVIPISDYRLVSCSFDHKIHIWKDCKDEDESPKKSIMTYQESYNVYALLEFQKDQLLYSCGDSEIGFLRLWDLNLQRQTKSSNQVYTKSSYGMIKLPNGLIAISSEQPSAKITIFDAEKFQVKHEIISKNFIKNTGSAFLLNFNEDFFYYSYQNTLVQITIDCNYNICYEKTESDDYNGSGFAFLNDGKFCIRVFQSKNLELCLCKRNELE